MLTFKDYKVKAKKIINVLFPSLVSVGTYEYMGHTIYEDLYHTSDDFYYQRPETGWVVSGTYESIILNILECILKEEQSECMDNHACIGGKCPVVK